MLVTVEDGRAVRIAGDPEHPVTQGFGVRPRGQTFFLYRSNALTLTPSRQWSSARGLVTSQTSEFEPSDRGIIR